MDDDIFSRPMIGPIQRPKKYPYRARRQPGSRFIEAPCQPDSKFIEVPTVRTEVAQVHAEVLICASGTDHLALAEELACLLRRVFGTTCAVRAAHEPLPPAQIVASVNDCLPDNKLTLKVSIVRVCACLFTQADDGNCYRTTEFLISGFRLISKALQRSDCVRCLSDAHVQNAASGTHFADANHGHAANQPRDRPRSCFHRLLIAEIEQIFVRTIFFWTSGKSRITKAHATVAFIRQ